LESIRDPDGPGLLCEVAICGLDLGIQTELDFDMKLQSTDWTWGSKTDCFESCNLRIELGDPKTDCFESCNLRIELGDPKRIVLKVAICGLNLGIQKGLF